MKLYSKMIDFPPLDQLVNRSEEDKYSDFWRASPDEFITMSDSSCTQLLIGSKLVQVMVECKAIPEYIMAKVMKSTRDHAVRMRKRIDTVAKASFNEVGPVTPEKLSDFIRNCPLYMLPGILIKALDAELFVAGLTNEQSNADHPLWISRKCKEYDFPRLIDNLASCGKIGLVYKGQDLVDLKRDAMISFRQFLAYYSFHSLRDCIEFHVQPDGSFQLIYNPNKEKGVFTVIHDTVSEPSTSREENRTVRQSKRAELPEAIASTSKETETSDSSASSSDSDDDIQIIEETSAPATKRARLTTPEAPVERRPKKYEQSLFAEDEWDHMMDEINGDPNCPEYAKQLFKCMVDTNRRTRAVLQAKRRTLD